MTTRLKVLAVCQAFYGIILVFEIVLAVRLGGWEPYILAGTASLGLVVTYLAYHSTYLSRLHGGYCMVCRRKDCIDIDPSHCRVCRTEVHFHWKAAWWLPCPYRDRWWHRILPLRLAAWYAKTRT